MLPSAAAAESSTSKPHPLAHARPASLCQHSFFLEAIPMFKTGLQKTSMQLADVTVSNPLGPSKNFAARFGRYWSREQARAAHVNSHQPDQSKHQDAKVWRAGMWSISGYLSFTLFLRIVTATIGVLMPLTVAELISWISRYKYRQIVQQALLAGNLSPDDALTALSQMPAAPGEHDGYYWACAVFLLSIVESFSSTHGYFIQTYIFEKVSVSLQALVYRKSLSLDPSSHSFSQGYITNIIASDCDKAANFLFVTVGLLVEPAQVAVLLYFLYDTIKSAAFGGLAVMFLFAPLFGLVFGKVGKLTLAKIKISDERVKLLNEVLQGIRIVKFYAWETMFVHKISGIRELELTVLRSYVFINSLISTLFLLLPMVIQFTAFIIYTEAMGEKLDPYHMFKTISLFNSLNMPLLTFPANLTEFVKGRVSLERISQFLLTPASSSSDNDEACLLQAGEEPSITLHGGYFDYEKAGEKAEKTTGASVAKKEATGNQRGDVAGVGAKGMGATVGGALAGIDEGRAATKTKTANEKKETATREDADGGDDAVLFHIDSADIHVTEKEDLLQKEKGDGVAHKEEKGGGEGGGEGEEGDEKKASSRFSIQNLNLTMKGNGFYSIVGPVGSGKSSILSALLGNMQRRAGSCCIKGKVAYVAQTAWIQSMTARENILFGLPYVPARYAEVVEVCGLEADFAALPAGDLTQIGDKGITLSGGQKQRIALCRAVYSDADIFLLDSPLAAVDAHVGRHIFEECFQKYLKNKLRVLVTHHLHLVPHTDYIFVVEGGVVLEEGSFAQLSAAKNKFEALCRCI